MATSDDSDAPSLPGVDALRKSLPRLSTEQRSIAELMLRLDGGDDQAKLAARQLVTSSEMAPELFPDVAIGAMAEHLGSRSIGSLLLQALRRIFNAGHALELEGAVYSRATASDEWDRRLRSEVGLFIADRGERHGPEAVRDDIHLITDHVYYYREIFGSADPQHEPDTLAALSRLGKLSIDLVSGPLNDALRMDSDGRRSGAAKAIEALLDDLPELGSCTIEPLLDSLQIPAERHSSDSPHGALIDTVAAIYIESPSDVQPHLDSRLTASPPLWSQHVLSIYREVSERVTWPLRFDNEISGDAVSTFRSVVLRVINHVEDAATPYDVRSEAADVLADIVRLTPDQLADQVERILAILEAIVAAPPKAPSLDQSSDQLAIFSASLEHSTASVYHRNLADKLASVYKTLAWLEPQSTLDLLSTKLAQLSGPSRAPLTALLLRVYGSLGRRRNLLPKVIPALFPYLRDERDDAAPLVRGAAAEAVEMIARARWDDVPEDVLYAVADLLTDKYAWPSGKALDVFERAGKMSIELSQKVIDQLLTIAPSRGADWQFIENVLMTALWVGWRNPDLVSDDVLSWVEIFVRHAPADKAAWIVWRWMTMLDAIRHSEKRYAACALELLARPDVPDVDRMKEIRGSLLRLPPEALEGHADGVVTAGQAHLQAGRADWVFSYIELLSRMERHGEAADLAWRLSKSDPESIYGELAESSGPLSGMYRTRHAREVQQAALIAALLRAEDLIARGDISRARAELADESYRQEDQWS